MARKTFVELIDDLDGSTAEETVTFSLDGKAYELDLNAENAGRLRGALEEWIKPARRASSVGGSRRRTSGPRTGRDAGPIREWARANGYEVSDRGRIPSEVEDAYNAAH